MVNFFFVLLISIFMSVFLVLIVGTFPTSGIRARLIMVTGDSSLREKRMIIEKFDGRKNFSIWQVRMKDTLVQQGIEDALCGEDDKLEGMTYKMWKMITLNPLAPCG